MEKMLEKHSDLNKIFQQYKLNIIREGKPIPLDFIMVLPKAVTRKIEE